MENLHRTVTEIVKSYIQNNLELSDDLPLKDAGIESIDVVKIVVDLENALNIEVLDSDLIADNFSTVSVIEETLQKYFMFKGDNICKAVVLDCDGILWDGVAGESGNDSVFLKSQHLKLHKNLRLLKEKGVLLIACTENLVANIENELSQNHSTLRVDDFALFFDNVYSKKECLNSIVSVFEFSPECIMFTDDSPRHCVDVSESLIIPEQNIYFVRNVNNLNVLFERLLSVIPDTNIDRTIQFKEQLEREKQYIGCSSPEEINQKLQTTISCRKAEITDASRIFELSSRSNRFNISGNHLSLGDVQKYILSPAHDVIIAFLKDRVGDMGLVGFSVLQGDSLLEFVISCRVFHRNVENALIEAQLNSPKKAIYCKTKYNIDALDFLYSQSLI